MSAQSSRTGKQCLEHGDNLPKRGSTTTRTMLPILVRTCLFSICWIRSATYYLPLYVFRGDHLLCARLRSSNRGAAHGVVPELKRIVSRLRKGKGYHSTDTVLDLKQLGLRSYLSEPARKRRRRWQGWVDTQLAVYGNQRRIRSVRGQRLQRQSSERVERPFAHQARDRRAASDLRPGPRQCAQVTASADMGNQSRSFDTLSDRCRTPRSLQARGVPSIVAPLVGWSAFGRPLKRFRAPLRLHPSICASTIHHQPI